MYIVSSCIKKIDIWNKLLSAFLCLNLHKLVTLAFGKINNWVCEFTIPFWNFRLGILLESVRIEEHVAYAQIYLFLNVFESIHIRENPFGKYVFISQLYWLFFLLYILTLTISWRLRYWQYAGNFPRPTESN